MQITINTDDNIIVDQILNLLEPYKKKGIKVSVPTKNTSNTRKNIKIDNTETESIQEKFNNILGKYAKERGSVSISEDKKILQEVLWDKCTSGCTPIKG